MTEARSSTGLIMLLLGVDPGGLHGVLIEHPLHEQARDFTAGVRHLLGDDAPLRRVPIGVSADRLIGGVDLAATLAAGRLVGERGVLAGADGGVAVFPMAERLTVSVRTVVADVLDHDAVQVARDGIVAVHDARIVAVLLDESVDDERVAPSLIDRVAFRIGMHMQSGAHEDTSLTEQATAMRAQVRSAAQMVSAVQVDDRWFSAFAETADACGVDSLRASLMAVRCARAHAALHGRTAVVEEDAELAAALVLAPRATRMPSPPDAPPPETPSEKPAEPPPPPDAAQEPDVSPPANADQTPPPDVGDATGDPPPDDTNAEDDASPEPTADSDLLRDAVAAALPPGMLAALLDRAAAGLSAGRQGTEHDSYTRGRPRGARAGMPRGGARLHLLETLRAAAPWQRARQRAGASTSRIAIRREDFRIRRYVEATGTTVIFAVDASGSSALQRLGEAKGAIELLLAESYARRDMVSLLAFRAKGTETLLPPTRALARAKRVLAALPGGGGTPLAHAIEAALQAALAARRSGSAPLVVMLTDGRANIARDGTPGRPGAERDALLAASHFAAARVPALFVDTSVRGEPLARKFADAMRARYVLLPAASAQALGGLVRTAIASGAAT